jgi:hypothetical protein
MNRKSPTHFFMAVRPTATARGPLEDGQSDVSMFALITAQNILNICCELTKIGTQQLLNSERVL